MYANEYHHSSRAIAEFLKNHEIVTIDLWTTLYKIEELSSLENVRLAIHQKKDGLPLEVRADHRGNEDNRPAILDFPDIKEYFHFFEIMTGVTVEMPRPTTQEEYGDITGTILRGVDNSAINLYIKNQDKLE